MPDNPMKTSAPLTTEEVAGRIAAKSDEPSLRALASAWGSSPGISKAIRRRLRHWAYAAGHTESDLDDAADRSGRHHPLERCDPAGRGGLI